MIYSAFAKKNEDKIWFEKRKEITTVGPLLSFIWKGMKKIIALSILSLSLVGLMWCATKQENTTNNDSTQNTSNTTACKEAIAAYLQQAKTTTDGDVVAKGNTITVDYVGRLDEQTVFDTSVESIAKACGKYSSGRNYNEWLSFGVGAGQMIAWFDKGVEGMKVWETKTVSIAAKDAYGERDASKLITMPKAQIPDADKYEVGMQVMTSYGQAFKVYKVNENDIVFDANHELAGKTLIFDITVKSIQK